LTEIIERLIRSKNSILKTRTNKTLFLKNKEILSFINRMGQFYEEKGVPPIGGRMLGLGLVMEEPLSQEDIQEILGVSRSSVSTNLRILLVHGMLEVVRPAGERKDHYVFSPKAWERAMEVKISSLPSLFEIVQDGIKKIHKLGKPTHALKQTLSVLELDLKYTRKLLEELKALNKK
jgi:DNA-binding transcriptional regulator GbsR (MarR family)